VLMTLQPILVALTKVNGKYLYVQVSTTFIAEVVKFVLSGLFYLGLPSRAKTHHMLTLRNLAPFAIPGAIYFVNNNLIFIILAYVNSTTYQILSSLKTVFTGILFRVILKHKLGDLQMLAIVLLTCGTATSQIGTAAAPCEGQAAAPSSRIGVAAAVLTCVLSAFGGVYSERLMKQDARAHSIHLQNMLLYLWGVGFNLLALVGGDGGRILQSGLVDGYTLTVWLLVLNNALNGLAISAILKYTDNIVRVFAHAAAMMLTMILEVGLFGATPTPQLLISATVVACAVYLYNRSAPPRIVLQTRTPGCTPSESYSGYAADGSSSGNEREREKQLLLGGANCSEDDENGLAEAEDRGTVTTAMLVRGTDGYSIRRSPFR